MDIYQIISLPTAILSDWRFACAEVRRSSSMARYLSGFCGTCAILGSFQKTAVMRRTPPVRARVPALGTSSGGGVGPPAWSWRPDSAWAAPRRKCAHEEDPVNGSSGCSRSRVGRRASPGRGAGAVRYSRGSRGGDRSSPDPGSRSVSAIGSQLHSARATPPLAGGPVRGRRRARADPR